MVLLKNWKSWSRIQLFTKVQYSIEVNWFIALYSRAIQYIKTPLAKSRENNKTKKLRINLGHPNPTPTPKWTEKTNPNPTPNIKPNPKPKIYDP